MSPPVQRPASNSDARKRLAEARLDVAIALCLADDSWEHHDRTDDFPCSGCRTAATRSAS